MGDEADEMLSRGFKDQIYDIFKTLPPNVQVCLFSATMPPEILDMTTKFMRDAVRILVKKDELTLEGIRQFYVAIEKEEWKLDTLCDLSGSMDMPGMNMPGMKMTNKSTPGMPGMPPMSMSGMSMHFKTGGWSSSGSVDVLFSWWTADSYASYVATLIAVFFIGMFQEALSVLANVAADRLSAACKRTPSRVEETGNGAYSKFLAENKAVETSTDVSPMDDAAGYDWEVLLLRLQASGAYGIFVAWHFVAMLIFMTYNVGICVVLILGFMAGHFVWKTGKRSHKQGSQSKDCHSPPARHRRHSGSF